MTERTSGRPASPITAYALLTLTALLWAGNAVAGKWAVGEVSPQVLTTLRWAFAFAVLIVIARRPLAAEWRRLLPRWPYVLLMGASGYTIFASLFYAAGAHTTALNVALIQGAVPILVMLLNFFVRGARVRPGQGVGAAITLAGVAVASSHGDLAALLGLRFNLGDGLMLAACLVYAGYTVALPARPAVSALAFFTALALSAFLSSLPPLAAEWAAGRLIWPTPTVGWPLVAFVALGPSLVAQLAFLRGVELIGPNRAGLFVNLVPVFGAGLAVMLAGEAFGPFDALALALVLGGILTAEAAGRRAAPPPPPLLAGEGRGGRSLPATARCRKIDDASEKRRRRASGGAEAAHRPHRRGRVGRIAARISLAPPMTTLPAPRSRAGDPAPARPPSWAGDLVAVAVTGLAGLLRYAFDHVLPTGFPFLTFFPAVILTTFFFGLRAGIVCAVLSGLCAWCFFIAPAGSFVLNAPSALALGFYAFIVAVDIALIHLMRVAGARLAAERAVTAGLYEQQRTMFQELQHRVANNMQFVAALLALQKRKAADDPAAAASALDEAQARLETIARIHRRLHDPARIDQPVGPYLQELCADLLDASGARNVVCLVDVPPLRFDLTRLTALSLLVVEVVTNALKHAFAGAERGTITIRLEGLEGARAVLTIADDGPGIPAAFDPAASRSLGLRIVQGLAAQLGGTITYANEGGTVVRLVFPAGTATAVA